VRINGTLLWLMPTSVGNRLGGIASIVTFGKSGDPFAEPVLYGLLALLPGGQVGIEFLAFMRSASPACIDVRNDVIYMRAPIFRADLM